MHFLEVQVMIICRWTSLASHNWAEIDHIRLVFFQIRKPKEGSAWFTIFCFFWRNQVSGPITVQDSESEGCKWSCLDCFYLQAREKIIYIWKPGRPIFQFSTLIWKNTSLIWSISTWSCDVRGNPPAYHHLIIYSMYFE